MQTVRDNNSMYEGAHEFLNTNIPCSMFHFAYIHIFLYLSEFKKVQVLNFHEQKLNIDPQENDLKNALIGIVSKN